MHIGCNWSELFQDFNEAEFDWNELIQFSKMVKICRNIHSHLDAEGTVSLSEKKILITAFKNIYRILLNFLTIRRNF